MAADPAAVAALDRPELARLWAAARDRLERNGRAITTAPLRLDDLSDAELDAICAALGRRRPADGVVKVSLRHLDVTLQHSAVGAGVVDTLEVMSGPVRDRRAERAHARGARDDLWTEVLDHPRASAAPVGRWLESLRRRGTLTRLGVADAQPLLEVLDALEWLDASRSALLAGPLPLSVVAAVRLGDGHALDPDTVVGGLLADALRALTGASDSRGAWADMGVQLDRVSSSVLTLNLPGSPGSIVHAAAATGEPLRLTHRVLDVGLGLDLSAVPRVWVCENPAIVSLAADRLGARCGPLVCTEGMPASVAGRLLGLLADAGVELLAHTDLDVGGVAIMSHLHTRFGARPWRLGLEDYLGALDGPTVPLSHPVGATPWDLRLGPMMDERRLGIHEEALFDLLLDDLDDGHALSS